jgi:hypothetical protein
MFNSSCSTFRALAAAAGAIAVLAMAAPDAALAQMRGSNAPEARMPAGPQARGPGREDARSREGRNRLPAVAAGARRGRGAAAARLPGNPDGPPRKTRRRAGQQPLVSRPDCELGLHGCLGRDGLYHGKF